MTATPTQRFRVWCLSWDDEEQCGTDVIVYDLLSHDHKSQERGAIYIPDTVLRTAADAAEAYANYAHHHRDGWESTWPLKFRVRSSDGSIADFEVDREYVAEFSARPVTLPKTPKTKKTAKSKKSAQAAQGETHE